MKGDENRYLIFGKADVVFEVPKSFESLRALKTIFSFRGYQAKGDERRQREGGGS